ncbi:hypothetical protein HDR63_01440 [bacterium]|nr:hypothetical protein [bacterium]
MLYPNVGLAETVVEHSSNCLLPLISEMDDDFCEIYQSRLFLSDGFITTYTCPDGYNLNAAKNQCTRANGTSITGNDTSGKYTITYESCEPWVETKGCITRWCSEAEWSTCEDLRELCGIML